MLTKAILAAWCLFVLPQAGFEGSFLLPKDERTDIVSRNQELSLPYKNSASLGVEVSAKSAIVIDSASGKVLFAKNSQESMPMASLTKMMTAVVVLESEVDLEDTVKIDSEVVMTEGADINLEDGEEMRVGDLLQGMLISSGNDAAVALAKKVGGDIDSFAQMMNKKAAEIGLDNSNFLNPSGLDEDGHQVSAQDLAILANYAYQNPIFKEIVGMKEKDIQDISGENNHHLKNTNKLLRDEYSYILGGKTGYTDNAGFCLTTFSRDSKGEHKIITIVLDSKKNGLQFQDNKALVEWTLNNYQWN